MHDTRLEDSLRRALHEEADALPFTITVDDLNVRLAQRPRRVSRPGILSAAAAVVFVVGAGAIVANLPNTPAVGNSPSPEPSLSTDLETFDNMRASIGDGVVLLTGERLGAPTGDDNLVTYDVGSVAEPGFHSILWDCAGPGPFTVGWRIPDSSTVFSSVETPTCEGPGEGFTSPEKPADAVLFVSASPATSWRVLAYSPTPENISLPDVSIEGAGWTPDFDEATEHQEPLTEPSDLPRNRFVGTLPPGVAYGFAYACLGSGTITVAIGEPGTPAFDSSSTDPCDGLVQYLSMSPATADHHEIWITVDPQAAWRIIGGVSEPAAPPTLAPFEVDELYEMLGGVSGNADSGAGSLEVDVPASIETLSVLAACAGDGSIELSDGSQSYPIACEGSSNASYQFVPPAASRVTFTVEPVGDINWAIEVRGYDLDANPDVKFIPPVARLTRPDGDAAAAVTGCGLGFTLANGSSGYDSCGPDGRVIPADRALHVTDGAEVTFELGDGWIITNLSGEFTATADLIGPTGIDATYTRHVSMEDLSTETVAFEVPGPGDWTFRLSAGGDRGGDSFGVPYLFRVIVER